MVFRRHNHKITKQVNWFLIKSKTAAVQIKKNCNKHTFTTKPPMINTYPFFREEKKSKNGRQALHEDYGGSFLW
jgi:hypothetical protein